MPEGKAKNSIKSNNKLFMKKNMMEIIHNIATFMHTADKAFWHEKMNTNRYFATVSVLFALLAGFVSMQGFDLLANSFLKWQIYPSRLASVGVLIVLIALNVCESIFGAKDVASGLLRSLWVTVVIGIVFLVGMGIYYHVVGLLFVAMAVLLVGDALLCFGIAARKSLTASNNRPTAEP